MGKTVEVMSNVKNRKHSVVNCCSRNMNEAEESSQFILLFFVLFNLAHNAFAYVLNIRLFGKFSAL